MKNIDINAFQPPDHPDEDDQFDFVSYITATDAIKFKEANNLLRSLNAEVDMKMLNETLEKLPHPKIAKIMLKTDDLVEGKEMVEKIQCNICLGIPIKPVECYDCNAIYCSDCMENHKKHNSYPQNQKCPKCRSNFLKMKPMNRILRQLTIDKLVFKCSHCGIDDNNKIKIP